MGRPRAAPTGPEWYRTLSDGWLRSLARRGRARTTDRTYRWVVRDFGRWLEHCQVAEPAHLVDEVAYSWQDNLIEREVSLSAQQMGSVVLRGMFRWAARQQFPLPPGLWERIDPISRPETEPRPLEPDALRRILAHYAGAQRGFEQLRDRALFLFLVTTGSRITAALSVDREQASMSRIVVVQKGGRQHALVPSTLARRWMGEYLKARGRDDQAALWIRIGARGRHRLLPQQANEVWAELARELKIPPFTSHTLKHTSATELGEFTGSDQELAEHMGWRGTGMVPRYRRIRTNRRQQLVDQLDELVPQPPAPATPRRRRPASMRVLRGPRRKT